jgi:hypothetical protein
VMESKAVTAVSVGKLVPCGVRTFAACFTPNRDIAHRKLKVALASSRTAVLSFLND